MRLINLVQYFSIPTFVNLFAGAASVNYHILSAESRKYFRNAIPMSGSVENYWALYEEKDYLRYASVIANDLGEPQSTYDKLVETLKTIPTEKLHQLSYVSAYDPLFVIKLGPVIESTYSKW